eukprot:2009257-Prymnesium_polylepis.2
MTGQRAYLDSSDLVDLRVLFEEGVGRSDIVVLLLTKDVLTRPWCTPRLLPLPCVALLQCPVGLGMLARACWHGRRAGGVGGCLEPRAGDPLPRGG